MVVTMRNLVLKIGRFYISKHCWYAEARLIPGSWLRNLQDPSCGRDDRTSHHENVNPLDKGTGGKIEAMEKSKRSVNGHTDCDVSDPDVEAQGIELASKSSKMPAPSHFECVRLPVLIFPKSAYQGHTTTLPVSTESDVLQGYLVSLAL